MISAVFFDFGGVLLSSPFEAFELYEKAIDVPTGTIRTLNANNHHGNAWARLERGELDVDSFVAEFEAEALVAGVTLDGHEVLKCLHGELRPQMVEALRRCSERFRTALLTNNFISGSPDWSSGGSFAPVLEYFDVVVESSVAGCRKPEIEFYETALERVGVAPSEVVFLDDLGVNLKPAREMGMTTIKVEDPAVAIQQLQDVVGIDLS
ncbi:MAG: HAD-IA family hydrolase [Microthrixaceae bacterium]